MRSPSSSSFLFLVPSFLPLYIVAFSGVSGELHRFSRLCRERFPFFPVSEKSPSLLFSPPTGFLSMRGTRKHGSPLTCSSGRRPPFFPFHLGYFPPPGSRPPASERTFKQREEVVVVRVLEMMLLPFAYRAVVVDFSFIGKDRIFFFFVPTN